MSCAAGRDSLQEAAIPQLLEQRVGPAGQQATERQHRHVGPVDEVGITRCVGSPVDAADRIGLIDA